MRPRPLRQPHIHTAVAGTEINTCTSIHLYGRHTHIRALTHTRRLAERHKTVAGTEMNARSSRSHTVFQLAISAARAALVPGGKVARPYVCVPVLKAD